MTSALEGMVTFWQPSETSDGHWELGKDVVIVNDETEADEEEIVTEPAPNEPQTTASL